MLVPDVVVPSRRFPDRRAAGASLASALAGYRVRDPIVLGIPRGGVEVAAEVAQRLGAELDIVVARKLGAPGDPELAIGAVTSDGGRWLNGALVASLGIDATFIDEITRKEMAEARDRERRFRGNRLPPAVAARTVILIDDGLATGATVRAAARALRKRKPARLVIAAPVGAPETCHELLAEADDVVCPFRPSPFGAVSNFYESFEATSDEAVEALLLQGRARVPTHA